MPLIVTFDWSRLGDKYKALGPGMYVAAKRGALVGALRGLAMVQRATSYAPPANPSGIGIGGAVNTGYYLRAWRAERIPEGARLLNKAPYAGVIEGGRRAGARRPPNEPIVRWIQRRLGKSEEEARRLSFVVRRAIARRGLLARRVLEGQMPDIKKFFFDAVEKSLDAALVALAGSP